MKTYIKLLTLALISALCFTSCVVVPRGTPAQQVDQTYANASVATGVGLVLLGTAATVWSVSHHDHYYCGPYYGGYYGGRCYPYYPRSYYCR